MPHYGCPTVGRGSAAAEAQLVGCGRFALETHTLVGLLNEAECTSTKKVIKSSELRVSKYPSMFTLGFAYEEVSSTMSYAHEP